jgi:hypothetical protein
MTHGTRIAPGGAAAAPMIMKRQAYAPSGMKCVASLEADLDISEPAR